MKRHVWAGMAAAARLVSMAIGVMALAGPAAADTTGLMERIQERADLRTAVLRLITGEDDDLALAAFEESILIDDPELRLTVMEAALSSADVRLRKAALRQFLDKRPEIRMEVLLPDRPDKAQQVLYDTFHGFRLLSVTVDRQTDLITFDARAHPLWSGQLVEDGFDLTLSSKPGLVSGLNCVTQLRTAPGMQLTGQIDCNLLRQYLQRADGIGRGVVAVRMRIG